MNCRIVILAEGKFSPLESKTCNQAIRYLPNEVIGVIDSRNAGKTAQQILGFGGDIPIFSSLQNSFSQNPNTLLIGIAPIGGRLPNEWRAILIEAIQHKLNIISGLHTFLSENEEFSLLAKKNDVTITDLRKIPSEYEVVAKGSWKTRKAKTILTVGTDCNVGKMTASLELHKEFLRRNLKSDFVATGQTGILLSGRGIAIDSVVSDFVAGAIELEIDNRVAEGNDFIHVEGQGSLTHQGYSSVTLGLLHGVMPDAMILVHHPIRERDDYGLDITDVRKIISLHEQILSPFKKSKVEDSTRRVVGIAMNTVNMNSQQIAEAKKKLEDETGLVVANVLSDEVFELSDEVLKNI